MAGAAFGNLSARYRLRIGTFGARLLTFTNASKAGLDACGDGRRINSNRGDKKTKRLTAAEIEAFEAKRDIGEEILQSIRDLKAGKGKVVVSPAVEA